MLGLDEPTFHALVGFVIGVVLTLLVILLVDFLYRRAVYTAQARLASRLDALRLQELGKLNRLEALGTDASKTIKTRWAKPTKAKPEEESTIDTDEPEPPEPMPIYPPADEVDESEPEEVVVPDDPRYQYFVTGNNQPFDTLRGALQMFPVEAKKNEANPDWDYLPKYVKDNIRRVPVVR